MFDHAIITNRILKNQFLWLIKNHPFKWLSLCCVVFNFVIFGFIRSMKLDKKRYLFLSPFTCFPVSNSLPFSICLPVTIYLSLSFSIDVVLSLSSITHVLSHSGFSHIKATQRSICISLAAERREKCIQCSAFLNNSWLLAPPAQRGEGTYIYIVSLWVGEIYNLILQTFFFFTNIKNN